MDEDELERLLRRLEAHQGDARAPLVVNGACRLSNPVPFPEGLAAKAEEAESRLLTRQSPPRIRIEKGENGWQFTSPYEGDDTAWYVLLCDAFGTRHGSIVDHFLECIMKLVPEGEWHDAHRCWYPEETSFNAVLAIISSLRPENEAQAAFAAQLAALHLSAMKMSEHIRRHQAADPRTVAILARTTRAYGDGMERMARLQGKIQPRQVNQTIQVVYVDSRDQRSVTINGGVPPDGGQPHGAAGGATVSGAALPSPCEVNEPALPVSSGAEQAGLPRSWWGARLWRALGRA